MKLTPLDIRKHEFARGFRGYDPEEVRAFLDMLSRQWEEALDELRHAESRVREIEAKIEHYERVEEALQEALTTARSNAKRSQEHAEERARLIVEEAELRAEQIIKEAEHERYKLRQDVSKLSHRHAEVTARLRHFLMTELEILAQHEDQRPVGFMKLIPAREGEAPPPAEEEHAPAPAGQARPPQPAAPPVVPAEEETTYADLYARAADAARQMDAQAPEEEPEEAEEEPHWTLRSIVTDTPDEEENSDVVASASEKERIRRILEDLD